MRSKTIKPRNAPSLTVTRFDIPGKRPIIELRLGGDQVDPLDLSMSEARDVAMALLAACNHRQR